MRRLLVVAALLALARPHALPAQSMSEGSGGSSAASASGGVPAGFDPAWDELEGWLRGRLENEGIVGCSLYLVQRGETLGSLHHGKADIVARRIVDERTIFHWASITKTFTAVAFMQLRDRGHVSLDDPVVEWVPELRRVHNPHGPIDQVTFRDALSHSAGFRAPTWPWGGDEPWHPYEPTEWEQLVAMMPYTRLHFPPGSKFSYSNPAIIFVGKTIERISGEPYEAYIEKNLFSPLGMESAYFDITPYHLLEHRSNNYVVKDGVPRPEGLDFDTGITVSNGGLNASVPDMVRWLNFLLGYGPGAGGGSEAVAGGDEAGATASDARGGGEEPGGSFTVLDRSSLEEMFEPVVPVNRAEGSREWMGLGFFVYERDGRRYIGHTGSQKAFRSFFYIDPATGVGVVGVFNTVGGENSIRPDTDELRVELREKLLDEIFPLFAQ